MAVGEQSVGSFEPDVKFLETLSGEVDRKFGLGGPVCHEMSDLPPDLVRLTLDRNTLKAIIPATFTSKDRWFFFLVHQWQPTCSFLSKFLQKYPVVGKFDLWLDDTPSGSGLSFTRGPRFQTILLPDPLFVGSRGYAEVREFCEQNYVSWAARKDIVFWRGASTGYKQEGLLWSDLPRFQLCKLAADSQVADIYDVGISNIVQIGRSSEIAEIERSGLLRSRVKTTEFINYKFAIDIDGNSNSWPGLFTKMLMGNTILKVDSSNRYSQWYYDSLVAWTHYVPVRSDLADLDEKVLWCMSNFNECERIADNARVLASSLTVDACFDLFWAELLVASERKSDYSEPSSQ